MLPRAYKERCKGALEGLEHHSGGCFFLENTITGTHHVELYTDASAAHGHGAVFGSQWCYGSWSVWWTTQNIMLLELYSIVIALEIWGSELMNKRLVILTDSMALVAVFAETDI
jgi:hypothetical protein